MILSGCDCWRLASSRGLGPRWLGAAGAGENNLRIGMYSMENKINNKTADKNAMEEKRKNAVHSNTTVVHGRSPSQLIQFKYLLITLS